LLALGYRGLSMSATAIGPVKAMVLATDLREAEAFVAALMEEARGGQSLREKMRKFAKAQSIPV
jgi:phosphotransferase system, enzyme I, PtsP